MGALFAYIANRTDQLEPSLEAELGLEPPQDLGAWGAGFFQSGEVLLKRRPHAPEMKLGWKALTRDVRSDSVVIAWRRRNPKSTDDQGNAQPRRFQDWLFAQPHERSDLGALRALICSQLPDFLARFAASGSDADVQFACILAGLHEQVRIDHPELSVDHLVEALRRAKQRTGDLAIKAAVEQPELSCILANGCILGAAVDQQVGHWVKRSHGKPSLLPIETPERREGGSYPLRYFFFAQGIGEQEAEQGRDKGWQQHKSGHIAVVDRSLELQWTPW